jgi:DNA-3-methyladenine glycosylase II
MRLALCLDGDGYDRHGALEVRPHADGVACTVVAGDPSTLRRQVSRVLSLDHDGVAFDEIGGRDPVVGRLQRDLAGLRPPLFHSPYEAAAWSLLSARRSARQMTEVRRRLGETHGAVLELAGQPVAAFPTPEQLLHVGSFPGLNDVKIERLHAVARAAQEGWLDAEHLLGLGPEEAAARLQTLPGIGPFYAWLVVVRGTGFADVLRADEPELLAAVGQLYGLGRPACPPELLAIAEAWRPRRTWVAVLMRNGHAGLARPRRQAA